MAEYEKRVRKILSENGCTFKRHGKGDHDIWFSPITCRHVTVDTKIKSKHNIPRTGSAYLLRYDLFYIDRPGGAIDHLVRHSLPCAAVRLRQFKNISADCTNPYGNSRLSIKAE